jgi:diguanylate cyclase (GGDEF)-like protein
VVAVVSPDKRLRPGVIYEVGDFGSETNGKSQVPNPFGLEHANFSKDWRSHPFYSRTETETYLGAPIVVDGQMYGVVTFSSPEPRAEPFDAGETQLLQLMAQWAGSEIERHQARVALEAKQLELQEVNAKLEALATVDGLTGVKNRRALEQQLEAEVARSRRYKTPLSLILLDVDKFKQYNDTFGHIAGDGVLQEVAQLLQSSVRTIDFVARYGGEEFVVLLPNTDQDGALILAERLRAKIEQAPWKQRAVTASFGIAGLTEEMAARSELTAAADRALYHSKESGRNRVTHVQQMPTEAALPDPK